MVGSTALQVCACAYIRLPMFVCLILESEYMFAATLSSILLVHILIIVISHSSLLHSSHSVYPSSLQGFSAQSVRVGHAKSGISQQCSGACRYETPQQQQQQQQQKEGRLRYLRVLNFV